jgi:phosphoglycolate phosphatase-like HAD superfamily hydrolase
MGTSSGNTVIVFDLDGTLIDVAARDYAVYRDLLVEDRLEPLPFARYWPLRRERTNLATVLEHSRPEAAAYLDRFVARRSSCYEAPAYLELDAVLPGVTQTLAGLAERYTCRLITSRTAESATKRQLDALGLTKYFKSVHVAAGDKGPVLRSFENVIMVVGDTEHDIRLARDHGYASFAVTTGMRSREFLAALEPTHLCDGIDGVPSVLAHRYEI